MMAPDARRADPMIAVERRFECEFPVASVWKALSDLKNLGEWLETGHWLRLTGPRLRLSEGAAPGPGTRLIAEDRRGGKPRAWLVSEWDPPRRLHLVGAESSKGLERFEFAATLAPQGSYATAVELRLEVHGAGWRWRLLGLLLPMRLILGSGMDAAVERIKRALWVDGGFGGGRT